MLFCSSWVCCYLVSLVNNCDSVSRMVHFDLYEYVVDMKLERVSKSFDLRGVNLIELIVEGPLVGLIL